MISVLSKNEYESILELAKYIKPNFSLKDLSANDEIIVYEVDGHIVGFLEYYVNYETVELLNVAVLPSYRSIGVATNLVNYLLQIDGVDRVMLEVRESNKEAIALYNKLGFKTVRVIKNYYGSEEGYAMERRLK